MTISVWSAFTFAIRNTFRPVTLGFVGLQIATTAVIVTWTKVRIAQIAALDDPAAWQSLQWQTSVLSVALGLLSLPLFVILTSRLSADVFGRPFPVNWWRGSLRALRVFVLVLTVAFVPFFILGFLESFFDKMADPRPVYRMTSVLIPLLVVFWFLYIHIFYGYGVMFKGRFGFRQAREYSRGRLLRLLGGLALVMLAVMPIRFLLMYEPIQPRLIQPYGGLLGLSVLSGLMSVAFQLLVLRYFFEAMDEADARPADNPPPEIVPTAFEG